MVLLLTDMLHLGSVPALPALPPALAAPIADTLTRPLPTSNPPASTMEVIGRVLLAAALSGLIGWERKRADKPADVRTMILIATGAAAFTEIGQRLIADTAGTPGVQGDPTRVLSYIISGVGFLGAGAILHSKKNITGLTTAASIWAVAAVGAACGLGEFTIAFTLFGVTFLLLWTPWVYHGVLDARNGDDAEDTRTAEDSL